MPLGWGRAIGSYVGSHFGSLGRPPGTKKGIVQLYSNEPGFSSSSQLQNHNVEDHRSIYTSANTKLEDDQEHSSKNDSREDERFSQESEAANLSDGIVETSYVRGIQIGAMLALCYNLFSSHLRLRVLQSQKPILHGNTNKRQIIGSDTHIPNIQNIQEQKGGMSSISLSHWSTLIELFRQFSSIYDGYSLPKQLDYKKFKPIGVQHCIF